MLFDAATLPQIRCRCRFSIFIIMLDFSLRHTMLERRASAAMRHTLLMLTLLMPMMLLLLSP